MISCENNVVKYCFVVHVLWPAGEGSVEVCQWQRLFWRDSSKTTFVTLPYLKRPKTPRLVPSRYFRVLWGEKIGNQDGLRRAGCHGKDRLLTPRALYSIQTAFSLKQSDLTRKSDWVRVWKKPESQEQGYISWLNSDVTNTNGVHSIGCHRQRKRLRLIHRCETSTRISTYHMEFIGAKG